MRVVPIYHVHVYRSDVETQVASFVGVTES